MKNLIALIGVLALVAAIPVPDSQPQSSLDLLQIPFGNNKELDILSLSDENGKISERNKRTIDILRQLFPTLTQAAGSENGVDQAVINEEMIQTIRRVREAAAVAEKLEKEKESVAQDKKFEVKVELPSDQDGEASETENKSAPLDELTLDNDNDDENRNKRFLSFGGGASAGGSGGGSGNFLFDIVRTTADRVARAAGTVYRVVAGTESIDSALPAGGSSSSSATSAALVAANSTTSTNTTSSSTTDDDDDDSDDDSLISGSSGTQESDERANSADAHGTASAEGYTEGIPGPVTRLVVLANRGLSNLIQDLILRLAQTSERVVNFKARLITSLI